MKDVTLVPVDVTIRRVVDGIERVHQTDLWQQNHYDGTFMWEDGNYSCDCNRAIFFGEPEEAEACSDGRYLVKVVDRKTGYVWYNELEDA